MSTSPCLPTTLESIEEEEEEEYKKICEEHKQLLETLPKGKGWLVQHIYNYKGIWLNPITIKTNMVLHTFFKSQPSDIILASFPKTGTTWLKALMFSTINRHHPTNAAADDHHLLHHMSPQSTIPSLDFESYPINPDFINLPEPRLFSTHFARTLLPRCMASCKIVYICRDPKDVLISKWHFTTKLRSKKDMPPLTFDQAFELFCQGVSEFGPFWEHVLSYWRASVASPDKILFLKYEEMMMQPEVEVRKLAGFMGKPFTKEEEEKGVVEKIVRLCSFENLSNMEVNKKGVEKFGNKVAEVEKQDFFRKGEVGDWRNYLSQEMKDQIDVFTNEKLKGSGLILAGASV